MTAAEVASAEPNTTLRALLQRADLSCEQLARRLNRQAAQCGITKRVDPKTPYKWLRGSRPRPPWPDLTAAVLTHALGRTVDAAELGWARSDGVFGVPADTGLNLPWTAAGALDAAEEVTDTGSMDRRVFVHLTGGALTGPALEWLLARPATDVGHLAGRRVQAQHVDAIETMTAQLRRMDDRLGGGTVLDLIPAQVRHVRSLLTDHSYTESIGTRLHAAAAELLRLGGWLSYDAGLQAQAQRYWLAALRAAHAAGDRAIGANVLGFMSNQAKDIDLYSEAVKLADAARQGYPGGSPRVTAILNMRAAIAYASTRDVRECRAALDAAHEAFGATPPETGDPDWAYWFDEAQLNEQVGYCYTRLEDWERASNHLRLALRLHSDSSTRERVFTQAVLAAAYARRGDPEQACHVASKAVDALARDVNSDLCVGHVRRVQQALVPYRRLATVKQFGERIDEAFGAPAA
jgi:tetratricopeptide (TPR) repeat protein